MRFLILFVALAITVQNTCPKGWAAKTAFATCGSVKQSSHCPMREQKDSKQNGQDDVKRGISNVKQAFVIHIVRPDNSYQILTRMNRPIHIDPLTLTEIFADPIYKPPIFSLVI